MLSIPERAAQIIDTQEQQLDEINSRTIFLAGSKNVGKSTLLHMFLEKLETPRNTLVLEYSFGRKTNLKQAIDKNVCHIWEYGGKLDMLKNVLPVLPKTKNYYYCIMVDLSKPKTLLQTIEICLHAINETQSISDNCVTNLIILCGKYDLFKNFDTEAKKIVCSTLRSVALLNDAHLMFYSSKESMLVKRAKDIFNSIGFENGISIKDKQTNPTKPLFINKGADTWENIGVARSTFDEIKQRYYSKIPLDSSGDVTTVKTGLKKTHPEADIDKLIALKYDELREMETLEIDIMSIVDYLC
ncbi:cytoplasmic dynein 2 light intermediate chain 1 isoform X1 [Bombyx mori]|uniref:Cytoplasmic dynein 2 light intermediate chain 1 n=3 Tax=Bombyx mori TaxID=7091 RepID=A0A8R1WGL7_BOMMO|nr:cytoplasmic dynein 2 light intermediate chain 1 isoform X1 [Bombyx mori]